MTRFVDVLRQAEFSLASYAPLPVGEITAIGIAALINEGMAAVQAARFASEWRVIDQYTESSFPGASATVFGGNWGQGRISAIRCSGRAATTSCTATARPRLRRFRRGFSLPGRRR